MIVPKRPWLYLGAAVVLIVFSVLTHELRGMAPYLVVAGIAVVQSGYPTTLGWFIVFAAYSAAAALYAYVLGIDAFRLVGGQNPAILRGWDDSIVFVLIVAFAVGGAILLALAHPRRMNSVKDPAKQAQST